MARARGNSLRSPCFRKSRAYTRALAHASRFFDSSRRDATRKSLVRRVPQRCVRWIAFERSDARSIPIVRDRDRETRWKEEKKEREREREKKSERVRKTEKTVKRIERKTAMFDREILGRKIAAAAHV